MTAGWRWCVLALVFSWAVAGCEEDWSRDDPTCETALDESKVHCFYRSESDGGSYVWGDPGAVTRLATVSATHGYATYTLAAWGDGGFVIPLLNLTPDSTVSVEAQRDECVPAAMEITCPLAN